jgi:XRE family transcriptional regulator, regulator of sulfur utilization
MIPINLGQLATGHGHMTKHATGPATIGRAVSHLRTQRCMTLAELAVEAGVTQARIEAIEGGTRNPHFNVLEKLARGLGTTPANILRIADCLDTGSIVIEFARRVRELREARGVSQEELARRAALHRTGISKIDRGLTDPRLSTIMRLALGLDVPPGLLVEIRGGQPLSPEEFARHFGHLPIDGEG